MKLFAAHGLTKTFGGLTALDNLSIEIEEGDLVGIIGPNGAGKTTFFNCVTGVLEPDRGAVEFDGAEITGDAPHQLAHRGMVRTFQLTRELKTMTVTENVRLAAPNQPGEHTIPALRQSNSMKRREAQVADEASRLIDRFELDHLADEYSSNLSGGQRKLLELARALMLDPKLLMLDEPFAGVNPTLTKRIAEHINQLNSEGMTVVLIEHELETLTELVDKLIVLAQGQLLTIGKPEDVLEDERVIDAYLGE
ncbi:ABC transporter ATP-binding protein [Haladaptatus sp. NG-WS-4]